MIERKKFILKKERKLYIYIQKDPIILRTEYSSPKVTVQEKGNQRRTNMYISCPICIKPITYPICIPNFTQFSSFEWLLFIIILRIKIATSPEFSPVNYSEDPFGG